MKDGHQLLGGTGDIEDLRLSLVPQDQHSSLSRIEQQKQQRSKKTDFRVSWLHYLTGDNGVELLIVSTNQQLMDASGDSFLPIDHLLLNRHHLVDCCIPDPVCVCRSQSTWQCWNLPGPMQLPPPPSDWSQESFLLAG